MNNARLLVIPAIANRMKFRSENEIELLLVRSALC